jgi:hypothetical protein
VLRATLTALLTGQGLCTAPRSPARLPAGKAPPKTKAKAGTSETGEKKGKRTKAKSESYKVGRGGKAVLEKAVLLLALRLQAVGRLRLCLSAGLTAVCRSIFTRFSSRRAAAVCHISSSVECPVHRRWNCRHPGAL